MREERDDVVPDLGLDRLHAAVVEARGGADPRGRAGGHGPPRLARARRRQLHLEPALQPARVTPRPEHLRPRVARDHSVLRGASASTSGSVSVRPSRSSVSVRRSPTNSAVDAAPARRPPSSPRARSPCGCGRRDLHARPSPRARPGSTRVTTMPPSSAQPSCCARRPSTTWTCIPGHATPHPPEARHLVEDAPRQVDRDGEADAHRAAAADEDEGVDPDHLAVRVHQRAAAVAGVDGGVGLDHVLVDPGLGGPALDVAVAWR